jgi:hypothetical protein
MINFFKFKHPKIGYSYAVTTGAYVGEMLIFVEENEQEYNFISIPKNINRSIPKDVFESGLKSKIVEVVQKIDKSVYTLLCKQFEFNTKSVK